MRVDVGSADGGGAIRCGLFREAMAWNFRRLCEGRLVKIFRGASDC